MALTYPSHAFGRQLSQEALQELAEAHVVIPIPTILTGYHESIRMLAKLGADEPDLRQHPEWFVIEEWLEDSLPDAMNQSSPSGGMLTVVSVKGIIDDVEVEEWWATENDVDELREILDEHRLAYLDEYVRSYAEWEREEVGLVLNHVTLSIDDEPVLRFSYAKEPDSTFIDGPALIAKAGLELAECAAAFEAKGHAVGWNIWKSRPDAERLQVGLGRRRRRSS